MTPLASQQQAGGVSHRPEASHHQPAGSHHQPAASHHHSKGRPSQSSSRGYHGWSASSSNLPSNASTSLALSSRRSAARRAVRDLPSRSRRTSSAAAGSRSLPRKP